MYLDNYYNITSFRIESQNHIQSIQSFISDMIYLINKPEFNDERILINNHDDLFNFELIFNNKINMNDLNAFSHEQSLLYDQTIFSINQIETINAKTNSQSSNSV